METTGHVEQYSVDGKPRENFVECLVKHPRHGHLSRIWIQTGALGFDKNVKPKSRLTWIKPIPDGFHPEAKIILTKQNQIMEPSLSTRVVEVERKGRMLRERVIDLDLMMSRAKKNQPEPELRRSQRTRKAPDRLVMEGIRKRKKN